MKNIQTNNFSRVEWVDLLKGVSILWLILYHLYVYEWLNSPVPIFFFLSGMFYSDSTNFKHFIRKKTMSLLIPFIFFYILGISVQLFNGIFGGNSYNWADLLLFFSLIPADSTIKNPLGVGAIWFLLCLYEIFVIYYLLRLISTKTRFLVLTAFLCLIISSVLRHRYTMGSVFYLINALHFIIYFVLGNLTSKWVLNGKWKLWMLVLAIIAYMTRFIDLSYLHYMFVDFRDKLATFGLIFFLCFSFRWLASSLNGKAVSLIRQFLLYEGKNSLTILGVHLLILRAFTLFANRFNLDIHYALLFIFVCITCNVFIWLLNKYVPFLVGKK